jgi:ABC-type nitrate/sulfonate/bicarbonate transport system substrate-binding protein
MSVVRLLYRDFDRTPYLYALQHSARRYGIELEVERVYPEYGELLEAGATDVLAESYWTLQSFRARGAPFVSLASSVTWLNETLFVHPGVRTLDDLRGKRFAIRATGPSELIPVLWLEDQGLRRDVEVVIYSERDLGRWGQWKKVLEGECHATFVTNLYADAPRAAGLKPLPFEPYGYMGNVTLTTTEAFVEERPEDTQHLVEATFDATELFRTEPATVLEIMSREPMQLMQIDGRAALERAYAILRDELSPWPVPSAEAIANLRRMRLPTAPELLDFNPLLMWDLRFARRAQQRRAGAGG